MTEKILLVDDDISILEAFHRNLRREFSLEMAQGPEQAIQALEAHGPMAVIVSDMAMPGGSGADLLEEVRERWPDTVRIMLTGQHSLDTAVEAVNRGEVFRFLEKPCSHEALAHVLRMALEQYRLRRLEQELLENTLTGAIHALTEVVAVREPARHTLFQQALNRAQLIAHRLHLDVTWPMEAAACLAPLGAVCHWEKPSPAAPPDPFHPLTQQELKFSARLVEHIPRMLAVSEIIRTLAKHFDGSGQPADAPQGTDLPLASRILFATLAFTNIEQERHHRVVAFEELRRHKTWFDPEVLAVLESLVVPESAHPKVASLALSELRVGMVLAEDIRLSSGTLLFPEGTHLGRLHLLMIGDLHRLMDLQEGVRIRLQP